MMMVQIFTPADNAKGTAYGAYLATILESWMSWVLANGKDGEKQYLKKQYVADEINSMKSSLVGDMGGTGRFTPVYTVAITKGLGAVAFCKRGNATTPAKHKVELIIALPAGLRSREKISPSGTSVLMAEAGYVAKQAVATLKLDTENDDLIAFYRDAYGFEVSGTKFGERTPMALPAEGLERLAVKYMKDTAWGYARALPPIPK